MPRPPVLPLPDNLGLGDYDAVRTSAAGGASCPGGRYPCTHKGLDIPGEPGTVVAAPTDGWVLVSAPVGDTGVFSGYGPAVVLFAHDDRAITGPARRGSLGPGIGPAYSLRYSLLSHFDTRGLNFQVPYAKAEKLLNSSMVAAARPVTDFDQLHDNDRQQGPEWAKHEDGSLERRQPYPDWAIPIKEGQMLGVVGAARHIHWEIRSQPLAGIAERLNPRTWLETVDATASWTGLPASRVVKDYAPAPAPPRPSSSSAWLWVAAIAVLAMSERRR
jgi:hypothetical protein